MRLFISSLVAATILCALVVLLGCDASNGKSRSAASAPAPSPAAQTTVAGDGAARISVADLRAALDKGTAIVVDVRSEETYTAAHVKGAINIPEMNIAARASELPRDKTIVTYCS